MHEQIERPEVLVGSTYKIKSPLFEHALYVTINDIVLNQGTAHESRRPFEIFINSKNMDHFQWVVAITRIMSAVFRKGGDVTFLVEELKAVFDPRGGYFKAGGVYMPSIVAEIGAVVEDHMKMIGLIVDPELDEHPAVPAAAAAALATATSSAPAAPPVTEPTTSTVPAFTSRPAPAVAPVVPAPDSSQPAAAALAFSSVSSPNAGRSVGAGGAGPLLPASDGSGPAFEFADRIVIEKGARRLYLLRGDDVIVEYPVKLGLNPYGHKQREGDFRTPEGTYHLSRRNPRSEFFLSVEVSYPNEADRARARQSGVRPGGLIMIHGQPNVPRKTPDYYASNDWTDGCIAVSNSDMVDIWQRTRSARRSRSGRDAPRRGVDTAGGGAGLCPRPGDADRQSREPLAAGSRSPA
jgi:hypothetical protein